MQSWVNKANMINLSGRPADSVREYAAAAAACEQKGMLGDAVNILQTALTVATNAPGSTDVAQLEQTLRLYRDKLAEATALGATNAVPRKP
jgi:hypothetical protein